MRQFYTKFSLLFFFFVLFHLNVHNALSEDRTILPTKENVKPTTTKKIVTKTLGHTKRLLVHVSKKRKLQATKTYHIREQPRNIIGNFMPLVSKDIRLIAQKKSSEKSIAPDPFRFTMAINKESVAIGEELELRVVVDWMDYGINNGVRFLPEWYKYTLKVVLPKGFIQTGGDYTDFCTKHVDANEPQAVFTIKGKFEFAPEEPKFIILRGFEGFNETSEFIWKGEKTVNIQNINLHSPDLHLGNIPYFKNARIASSVCNTERNVEVCVTKAYKCGSNITKVIGTITTTNSTNTDVYLYWNINGTAECIIVNPGTNPGQKFTINKYSPASFTLEGSSSSTNLDIGIGGNADSNIAFGCNFDFSEAVEDFIITPVISSSTQLCSIKLSTANISLTSTSNSSSRIAAGETYQWKRNGINVGGDSNEYETNQTGSYTVTITIEGCSLTSAPMTINAIPSLPTPTINTSNEGCSVKLTASVPNVTYEWKKDGVIKGSNTQNYYVTEPGQYTVTIGKVGCTPASVTSGEITISTIPSLSAPTATISGTLLVEIKSGCPTGSTTTWQDGNPLSSRNIDATDITRYKAKCTKNGCVSGWSNEVGNNITNEPTSISVSQYTYCASNVTLTANGCNATKQTRWYFQPIGGSYGSAQDRNGNEMVVSSSFNAKVKVYCLDGTTLSSGNIERDVDATAIKSIPKPSGITLSSAMPFNPNQSVSISINGCLDNTDPAWSTDNINFTKIPTGSFNKSFTASGTLYAKCIYGTSCESDFISTPITVASTGCTSLPSGPSSASVTPSSYNDDAIPTSVALTANCGVNTPIWDKSGSPAPRVTTVFTVRCQDANGCVSSSTATATVTVSNPPPVCGTPGSPTLEGYDTSVCLDDNKTIFLYARNCEAGATVVWSDGHEGFEYQIAGNHVFSYSLTARCRRNCAAGGYSYSTASSAINLEVKDCEVTLPVPAVQIYNSTFCAGTDQAYLYARGCAIGQTIVWSSGFTRFKNSNNDDEYVTSVGGNYTAKCRDSRGRESSSSNSVTINAITCPPGCTDPNITKPNAPVLEAYNIILCPDSKKPSLLYARGCESGQTIVWSNGFTKVRNSSNDEEFVVWASDLINSGQTHYTITARCQNACGTSSGSNSAVIKIEPADKPILKSNSSLSEFGILGGIETGENLHVWVEPNAPALYQDFKWTFSANPTVISTTDKVDILSVRDAAKGTYKVSLKTGLNECVVTESIDVIIKPWECKLTVFVDPNQCYIENNKRWANLQLTVKNRTKNWKGDIRVQRIKDIDGEPLPNTEPMLINYQWAAANTKDYVLPLQVKIPDGTYRIQLREKRSDEESGTGFECFPEDIYITVGCQRKCVKLKTCLTGDCCGIPTAIDLNQEIKLETLAINDVVKANDFDLIITKVEAVNPANYSWNIEAISKIPVFDNVFIGLKSTSPVVFNECKEMVSGEIITLYNPTNWDKPLQAKAIAKALYTSAKEILEAITTNPDLNVEMSEGDITNVAQQVREQAAKDLPEDLELKANEAIRKMEEARAEYATAKIAGNNQAMDAATAKFNEAKADFGNIKTATEKYLKMYQNIVEKTLIKMWGKYQSVPDASTPTPAQKVESFDIHDGVSLNLAGWLTSTEKQNALNFFTEMSDKNLKRLFKYFVMYHRNPATSATGIKDLEQNIKVFQKEIEEPLTATGFEPVSPQQKLSNYIYTTMCKTCTGADPKELKMINTTEKAFEKYINEIFKKIDYTEKK